MFSRKKFNFVIIVAVLAVFSFGFVFAAEAASKNSVDRVLSLSIDADGTVDDGGLLTPPILSIKNDDGDWNSADGEVFRVILPTGCQWADDWGDELEAGDTVALDVYGDVSSAEMLIVSKTVGEVTISDGASEDDEVKITLNVVFNDPKSGTQKVTVDSRDSAVSSGSYAFAVLVDGDTGTTTDGTVVFGRSTDLKRINIDEQTVDSMAGSNKDVALVLPQGFRWNVNSSNDFINKKGTTTLEEAISGVNKTFSIKYCRVEGRTLEYVLNVDANGKRGSIVFDGLSIIADRDAPKGDVKLNISGSLVGDTTSSSDYKDNSSNNDSNDTGNNNTNEDTTITPASLGKTIEFTIGSTDYIVKEGTKKKSYSLDSAPYVEGGRTMMPLRAVAVALGIPDDKVIWANESKTAFIFKGSKTAQIMLGSKTFIVDGVSITLDAPAVLKNGRLMLPVGQLAKGLGVKYTWNDLTKTVIFESE